MEYTMVTSDEFAGLTGVDDWRFALGAIHAAFAAGSYPTAAEFVVAVTDAAEQLVHHMSRSRRTGSED